MNTINHIMKDLVPYVSKISKEKDNEKYIWLDLIKACHNSDLIKTTCIKILKDNGWSNNTISSIDNTPTHFIKALVVKNNNDIHGVLIANNMILTQYWLYSDNSKKFY